MAQIILILFLAIFELDAEAPSQALQESCLACHAQKQIPDALIYRRYLMTYSNNLKMKKAIREYLKNPKVEHSIMPSQFFLKFPMKSPLGKEDEANLTKNIDAFLDYFDVRKQLVLE